MRAVSFLPPRCNWAGMHDSRRAVRNAAKRLQLRAAAKLKRASTTRGSATESDGVGKGLAMATVFDGGDEKDADDGDEEGQPFLQREQEHGQEQTREREQQREHQRQQHQRRREQQQQQQRRQQQRRRQQHQKQHRQKQERRQHRHLRTYRLEETLLTRSLRDAWRVEVAPAAAVTQPFHIFVKIPGKKTTTFEVTGSDAVEDVKSKIRDKVGTSPDQQRLLFAGKQMEEGRMVVDYRVKEGSTLDVVLRMPGGMLEPECEFAAWLAPEPLMPAYGEGDLGAQPHENVKKDGAKGVEKQEKQLASSVASMAVAPQPLGGLKADVAGPPPPPTPNRRRHAHASAQLPLSEHRHVSAAAELRARVARASPLQARRPGQLAAAAAAAAVVAALPSSARSLCAGSWTSCAPAAARSTAGRSRRTTSQRSTSRPRMAAAAQRRW